MAYRETSKAKRAGEALMELADSLTDEECEITADEILENMEGRTISPKDAGDIRRWLNT